MDSRRALFFSGFPPARERRGGICGVTLTLALSHQGRGDDGMEMETREKPGAVFNPVLLRERSWICASAAEQQRRI